MKKVYVPAELSGSMPLQRLLIRSGFYFGYTENGLNFGRETADNREFFQNLIQRLGLQNVLSGLHVDGLFMVDQRDWIRAWQQLAGGAESGAPGFMKIELQIMDYYLAGISRWFNAIGLETTCGCDGHGIGPTRLDFSAVDATDRVRGIVERNSHGRLTYAGQYLLPFAGQGTVAFYCELLDLAEAIYADAVQSKALSRTQWGFL